MRKLPLPLLAAVCACAAVRAADDIPAWAKNNTITSLFNDKKHAGQLRFSDPAVAEAFCSSRLADDEGLVLGTLPPGLDVGTIIERARPKVG